MAANTVVLMGCGDVGPIHEPMDAYCVLARPVLAGADLRFGQVERVYSERGALQVHSGGGHSRCKPSLIFSSVTRMMIGEITSPTNICPSNGPNFPPVSAVVVTSANVPFR